MQIKEAIKIVKYILFFYIYPTLLPFLFRCRNQWWMLLLLLIQYPVSKWFIGRLLVHATIIFTWWEQSLFSGALRQINNQNCVFALKNKSSPSKSQPSSAFPNLIITDPWTMSCSVYSPGLFVLTLSSNPLLYLMVSRLKPVYFSMKGF